MQRMPTPDIMGDMLVAKTGPELIPLDKLRVDGGTQMRAGLNEATVQEYVEEFRKHHAWGPFPAVVLFYDGADYWVGDGFHRIEAYRRECGHPPTMPVHADVRAGDRRDAVLFAAGANANHGLRRTQADKRRSVETLLRDGEWQKWSDREIARICHVSADLVGDVRKTLAPAVTVENDSARTYTNRHGGTSTMNTAKIGSNQPKYAAVWELESYVRECVSAKSLTAAQLRDAVNARDRSVLMMIEHRMPANYRRSELNQAVNNVAAQMEAKAAGTNYPAHLPNVDSPPVRIDWKRQAQPNETAGTNLDPWAVAVQTPGSRQQRVEALARAITPWIREYRDAYGRTWRDIENPSHTNGTFWQDINKEFDRRGAAIRIAAQVDVAKDAIKQAFSWMTTEEPPAVAAWPGVTAHTWEGFAAWDDADQAEYDALAANWLLPRSEVDEHQEITRWRVAARLASERPDNIAWSLQDRARRLRLRENYAAQQAAAEAARPAEQAAQAAVADADEAFGITASTPPVVQLDDLEVVATVTAPAGDQRIGHAKELLRLYTDVINRSDEYGELTGRFTDMLPVERGLATAMDHLIDLLHTLGVEA